jgi:hypothetical protein
VIAAPVLVPPQRLTTPAQAAPHMVAQCGLPAKPMSKAVVASAVFK